MARHRLNFPVDIRPFRSDLSRMTSEQWLDTSLSLLMDPTGKPRHRLDLWLARTYDGGERRWFDSMTNPEKS